MAALTAALEDALAGRGRVVMLAGEPGIGKTRLAEELTDVAVGQGALVLRGECFPAATGESLWPWSRLLSDAMKRLGPNALKAAASKAFSSLAPIAPENLIANVAPDGKPPPGDDRRINGALSQLIGGVSQDRALVVVLEEDRSRDQTTDDLIPGRRPAGARKLLADHLEGAAG